MSSPKDKPIMPSSTPIKKIRETSPASAHSEGGEKPVREQLKKTSIDAAKITSSSDPVSDPILEPISAPSEPSNADSPPITNLKRTFGDLQGSESLSETLETPLEKKRSRGSTPDADATSDQSGSKICTPESSPAEEKADIEALRSPKGKRNIEQFLKDDKESQLKAQIKDEKDKPDHERDIKRPRDTGDKTDKIAIPKEESKESSKFQNSSFSKYVVKPLFQPIATEESANPSTETTKSPIGKTETKPAEDSTKISSNQEAEKPKTTPQDKPQSAFASSAFAKFISNKPAAPGPAPFSFERGTSVFGGNAAPFKPFEFNKSKADDTIAASTAPSLSAFGGFGSTPSPFGGALPVNLGFGSAIGGKSLNPFPGFTKGKPFGAPNSDNEDDGSDGDEQGSDDNDKKKGGFGKKDKRFQEQEIKTGEEGEYTVFEARCKIYQFNPAETEWRQRGVGALKLKATLNDDEDDEDDKDEEEEEEGEEGEEEKEGKANGKKEKKARQMGERKRKTSGVSKPFKARFILRTEGSNKLVLNSPISKQMKIGTVNGMKPTGSNILFSGYLDGKTEPSSLQVMMDQLSDALTMWDETIVIQQKLKTEC